MSIQINAQKRDVHGTGASRRLRRAGHVPGVLYGGDKDAMAIELDYQTLFLQFRHEAFHASVIELNLGSEKENVLLRDFQLHPVRGTLQHIDFQRVSATEKIHVKVPFHFVNGDIAPGVKLAGGIVAHILNEADVRCLAKDLPEFIEVDLAHLELGHAVHLSQIPLPKDVEFVQLTHGNDATVAAITKTRASASEDAADATETPTAGES